MPKTKRRRRRSPGYGTIALNIRQLSIDQISFAEYLAAEYGDRGIVDRYIHVCLHPSMRDGTCSIDAWDTEEEAIAL